MDENSNIMPWMNLTEILPLLLARYLLRPLVNFLQEAPEDFTLRRDCVTRTTMQSWNRRGVWLQHSIVHRPTPTDRRGPCRTRARTPGLVRGVECGRRRAVFMVLSMGRVECGRSRGRRGLFRNRIDQGTELFICLLFVFKVESLDSDFIEDLFDAGFTVRVFATIVFLRHEGECQSGFL